MPLPLPVTYELVAKFTDDSGARAIGGRVQLVGAVPIAARGLSYRPLLLTGDHALSELRARGERRTGRPQPDLGTLLVVGLPASRREDLEATRAALLALPQVEWAEIVARGAMPPGDLSPETPDLSDDQGYGEPDPGIDMEAAWDLGFRGEGIRVSDCEYEWVIDHEDLVDVGIELEEGQTAYPFGDEYGFDQHGTAVLGQMAAPDNGYGVTGLVPHASFAVFSEATYEDEYRREDAIASAIAGSEPGDVVVLEMQIWTIDDYGPAELARPVWEITRAGVDAGVIVVAAAGNGSQDLDSSGYASYRDRGDSGAIIVGAGSADDDHEPLYYTTYGERVDLQAWGEQIVTTGYGDLGAYGGSNEPEQFYTAWFGGTSGATPIVASAAVVVSQAIRAYSGEPATPEEVREILIETGIPQVGSRHIGPFPDLDAALGLVLERYAPGVAGIEAPDDIDEGELVELSVDPTWRTGEGGVVEWIWEDGSKDRGNAVQHAFRDDGDIEITLRLEDADGTTRERELTIQVDNVAPSLVEVDSRKPRTERLRELEAIVADPGDDVVEVHWAFDDGTEADGLVIEHLFGEEGPESVVLTLTDEDGGEREVTHVFDVRGRCGCDSAAPGWGLGALVALLVRRRRPRRSTAPV